MWVLCKLLLIAASAFRCSTSFPVASRQHDRRKALISAQTPLRDGASAVSIDEFHQWADENNTVRSVEVSMENDMGGGKGLIATRDLKPGEVAIHVPRALTIALTGHNENNNWAGSMASKLCYIQNEVDSETAHRYQKTVRFSGSHYSYDYKPFSWKPYVNFGMPQNSGPYTADRWTNDELMQLQNQTLLEDVAAVARWRASQYERFASEHAEKEFRRALSLVCSRALEAGPNSSTRMLVPFLDNANHAPKKDGGCSYVTGSASVMLFVGEKEIKKGEPVCLDYGPRSHEEYLLHYGFIPSMRSDGGDVISFPKDIESKSPDSFSSSDFIDNQHPNPIVRLQSLDLLNSFQTSLEEDKELSRNHKDGFNAFKIALDYRLAKKMLLRTAAGL